MSDGLKAQHRTAIIATLAANDRVEQAVLFGSRAMGTNTVTSDVDIALFGQQLTLTDQASLAAACEELPMAQSVDLVLHSTIDNPALVEHIRSRGVEWYRRGGGDDWQEMPFSEAFLVNPPTKLSCGMIYPYVDMSSLNPGFRSVYASKERTFHGSGSRFMDGDTLMARITPCLENGKTARYCAKDKNVAAHGSTEFIVIRGRPGVSASNFAFYMACSATLRDFAINQMTGTSGRQRVPTESLAHLTVRIPPLPEQKAIAHILGTLDDKIDLNRRMNETLEAMAKALFKSWFVDFDPVRAKAEGRSTGLPDEISALFPDSFEDSELGEIPRGWGVKRLEEYLELAYGKSLPAKSRRPGSVPVYGSGGVIGSHDVALTQGPTVIIGRKGTVGSLYLEAKPAFPIDTVFHTLPRIGSMLFCYHLLACQPLSNMLSNMNTDAAVPGLNRGNVYRLEFPCPTSDLISAFDGMVGSLWKRQVASLDESGALAQVRDSLLPKLIDGGLRVKGSEDFVRASI